MSGNQCNAGPLVSVIMAAYNAEAYLEEAVSSVLRQNYRNIEVIIVDDASTDGTAEILRKIRDPRVAVYTNPQNRKLAYSLNFALSMAKGEYVARMDADDRCGAERLVKQIDFLKKHRDIDVLGANYRAFGNARYRSDYSCDHESIRIGMLFENSMCHPLVVFRKNAISEWYDESFAAGQDYDLWTRLIEKHRFANLKDVLLQYRVHGKQTLSTAATAQRKGAEISRRRMLQNFGIDDAAHTENFLAYCAPSAQLTYDAYMELCKSVAYVRENARGMNQHIFDRFAAKRAWQNVLRLRKTKDFARIALYTLRRYPCGLLRSPRLMYLLIRSMLK